MSKKKRFVTAFKAAWDEWKATEEGKRCLDDYAPPSGKFLENRLHAAFASGWWAGKLGGETKEKR